MSGPRPAPRTLDPLEFLIPDQVMTRYYRWHASRIRGMRRRQAAEGAEVEEPVAY